MMKKIKIDENGYTLQKVILLSVLVLAAAGASILIYNAIAGKTSDVAATSASLSEFLKDETNDEDPTLSEEQILFKEENPELWQLLADNYDVGHNFSFSCAIHNYGALSCWGANNSGQLGNGILPATSGISSTKYTGPTKVHNINDAKEVATGRTHACTIHQDETVSCWGWNWNDALGFAPDNQNIDFPLDNQFINLPLKMVDTDNNPLNNVKAISVGEQFTCALLNAGTISCWGANDAGQHGDGIEHIPLDAERGNFNVGNLHLSSTKNFVKVLGIEDAVDISAGNMHACALHEDTTISCWGASQQGQLGNGVPSKNTDPFVYKELSPVKVKNSDNTIASGFTAIGTGRYTTCAIHSDETVSCWGGNIWSYHGNSLYDQDSNLPVKIVDANRNPIRDVKAITVARKYACALHNDGTITCWSFNLFEKVTGIHDAIGINGNRDVLCVLRRDETVSCFGDNSRGQLASGYTIDSVKSLGN